MLKMKMVIYPLLTAACCLAFSTSCLRDALYYPHSNDKVQVKVLIRPAEAAFPNAEPLSEPDFVYLGIYRAENGALIRKEILEEVGTMQRIELEPGRYQFVVYNEPYLDGEQITGNSVYYAGENNWETLRVLAKSYPSAGGSGRPDATVWIEDVVMSDRIPFFEITGDTTLYFLPRVVFPKLNVTLRIKNYTGWTFRRTQENRSYISGMATGYALGEAVYSGVPVAMCLNFNGGSAVADGITTFRASSFMMGFPGGMFPNPGLQTGHTLFVRFDYITPTGVESRPLFINLLTGEGSSGITSHYTRAGTIRLADGKKYGYDIWDLDVSVELEERTPIGGGPDPGLGEWEEEDVPLGRRSQAGNLPIPFIKIIDKTNK